MLKASQQHQEALLHCQGKAFLMIKLSFSPSNGCKNLADHNHAYNYIIKWNILYKFTQDSHYYRLTRHLNIISLFIAYTYNQHKYFNDGIY